MKIGILTLPLHTNYGGILQAYALQTVLERMGYQSEIINLVYPFWPTLKRKIKRIMYFLLGRKVFWEYEKMYPIKMAPAMLNIKPFISKYMFLSNEVRSVKKMKEISKNYDAFIIGSDQVWRPLYAQHIDLFFCSFLKKNDTRKRIAYAASLGTNRKEYNEKQQKKCGNLIKLFHGVSVREKDSVKVLTADYRWAVSPSVVLDPTLLLDKFDYEKIIEQFNRKQSNEGCIFYYFLDNNEEKKELLNFVCLLKKGYPYTVYKKEPNYFDSVIEPLPAVESWLQGFVDSDFIVTDSFHGCVFSIIFNKPFIVLGNKNRGISRFETLLENFNLESRMIFAFDKERIEKVVMEPIDWACVNRKKEILMNESIDFLRKNLE